jgi:hypothetical protein
VKWRLIAQVMKSQILKCKVMTCKVKQDHASRQGKAARERRREGHSSGGEKANWGAGSEIRRICLVRLDTQALLPADTPRANNYIIALQ